MLPVVAVITNRCSTRNLRAGNWIDAAIAGEAGLHHFPITRIEALPEAVRHARTAGAEVIVVNGGDGTAGLVFGELSGEEKKPALALLPGGKTNMTAAGWSLTGNARDALAALLRHRRVGTLLDHVTERAVLRLRRGGDAKPLYGAFFGAAEVVDTILFCRKHIYPLGLPNVVSHAAAVGTALARAVISDDSKGHVKIDDGRGTETGRFFLVAVSALDELLFGLRPTSPESQGVHLVTVNHGFVLNAVPDLLQRRLASGPGRKARRVECVSLAFDGAYTLDGELYEARGDRPLLLDTGPRLPFIRLAP